MYLHLHPYLYIYIPISTTTSTSTLYIYRVASRDTQAALVGQRGHLRLSSSLTEGMDELKDCQLSVWGDSIGIDLDGLVELGAAVAQELFLLWHVVHHDRQLQQPRSPCCACIKAPSPHCVSGPAAAAAATRAHARARTAIHAQASSHVTVLANSMCPHAERGAHTDMFTPG